MMAVVLLGLVASVTAAAPKLDLSVASDGSFTIGLDGNTWLAGSEYAVDASTASSGKCDRGRT
jgi:hypothetical protein